MANKFSRRHLFQWRPSKFVKLLRGEPAAREEPDWPVPWRPPGSMVDESSFLSVCQRCSNCVTACPHHAIASLGPEAGLAERTPVMAPAQQPCHWCPEMPCIESCPSGALSYGPDRIVGPIGKAVLNLDTCLNTHGTPCDACARACPTHLMAITMSSSQPQLHEERCTGCGLCAFHCESTPSSIQIRPL